MGRGEPLPGTVSYAKGSASLGGSRGPWRGKPVSDGSSMSRAPGEALGERNVRDNLMWEGKSQWASRGEEIRVIQMDQGGDEGGSRPTVEDGKRVLEGLTAPDVQTQPDNPGQNTLQTFRQDRSLLAF